MGKMTDKISLIWNKKAFIFIILLLFLAISSFFLLERDSIAGQEDPEHESSQEIASVEVIQARTAAVREERVFDGFTEPKTATQVMPGVGGDVVDIYADVGDEVQEGELIAQMEAEALDLGIKAAEEALNQARLELEMAETGARKEELAQAEAQYEAAQESLKLAEDAYERVEYLYENDVVAKPELDEAEMNLIEARASYDAAKQDLEMARTGARPEEIRIAEASISEAEYELEQARLSQQDLEVTAPVSGIVGKVPVEEGTLIGEDTPVAVIMDISELNLVVEASSRRIADIQRGQTAEVTFDSHPDRVYEGIVTSVYPAADEDSGQFEFEISVSNHDRAIKAGEYGEARVKLGEAEFGAEIPATALLETPEPHIYIIEDQMMRRVDVSIVSEEDGVYTVEGDINQGDLIVYEADEEYYDGYPAEMVEVIGW